MPSPEDPEEQNFEDESARLDEGLKSCRAVLSGYRALLSGDNDNGEAGVDETGEDREAED